MIVPNPTDKGLIDVSGDEHGPLLVDANSTLEPPPPFSYIPQPGPSHLTGSAAAPVESPPQFALYDADYFETSNGNIVSHDPHLNADGEALYRFLLAHADKLPSYRLHCRGTHVEHHTRWVTERANDGTTTSRRETQSETVTDFDFYINVAPPPTIKPIHWSVGDAQPAYRGHMVRETESLGNTQRAKRAVERAYLKWTEERTARGLPPWALSIDGWSENTDHNGVSALQSSKTIRQWADEYCASQKYLKEFVYEKVLYGWNIQQLRSVVRGSIARTMYQGTVEVDFERHGAKIYIKPDNRLSRMLSNKWLKFLSIILCIFPFIWLFKRFHSRGGGRWEVCGGAYAMRRLEPDRIEVLPDDGDTLPGYTAQARNRKILVGMRADEWFSKWEGTIIRSVRGRYQSSTPIFDATDYTHTGDPTFLDTYND
ncbi:hypothetical protein H2248_000895 [Termitomyces sp. 'cryptogamus']|nr:hypothetical protein H2248_000895 [Termitomyces sp. 'cryptogamus']